MHGMREHLAKSWIQKQTKFRSVFECALSTEHLHAKMKDLVGGLQSCVFLGMSQSKVVTEMFSPQFWLIHTCASQLRGETVESMKVDRTRWINFLFLTLLCNGDHGAPILPGLEVWKTRLRRSSEGHLLLGQSAFL